jgi:hypothetical protein
MSRTNWIRIALAAAFLFCTGAQAQLFRAYLSSSGSDGNPCTLQAPCRLLPAALAAVANNGEIWMLDSANYNTATVNIDRSVSILAIPGVVGSIVALNGGPAMSITLDGLVVALRNVVLGPVAGATPGTDGISMTGASSLTLEDSLIFGLPGNAISTAGNGELTVIRSTIRNGAGQAISLSGGARATISDTHILQYGGLYAHSNSSSNVTSASVSDSVISGASGAAVEARSVGQNPLARIAVTRSTIDGSAIALKATSNGNRSRLALITVSGSTIAGNSTSWHQSGVGSSIVTLGNNHITDNDTFTGTPTSTSLQ